MKVDADVPEAAGGLRVLAAATDAGVLRTIERACSAECHVFLFATDVAEAIATSAAEQPDLAFVDVTLDGGAGLSLVHHLPAVTHRISVYAIVPPGHLELGSQAMALGASGILVAPPSGDGLLLAISEVRGRRSAAEEQTKIRAELVSWMRRTGLIEGIAALAGDPDRAKTALAVAEALAEASRASGAAVYVVTGDDPEECTRLATMGSASILEDRALKEGVHKVPLALGSRTVGHVLLDHPSDLTNDGVRALLQVASAVLGASLPPASGPSSSEVLPRDLESDGRVFSLSRFQRAAAREVERARRHGRRLSIGAIVAEGSHNVELEDLILGVIRETDVLARGPLGAYYLLLPETGSLGAHACRRRVLRLASSHRDVEDRRGVPATRDAPLDPRLAIGVATYPHDGAALESLADRAHARALAAVESIVYTHGLDACPLGQIIDSLLEAPFPEQATRLPPFSRAELSVPAAHALVGAACREALRGGSATLLVAYRPDSGTLSVVRAAIDEREVVLHAIDASHLSTSGEAETLVLVAEHGTWAYCGRATPPTVLVAHSADPLLADVLADRLAHESGVSLP